jgi:Flp pilus assembly protein TadD
LRREIPAQFRYSAHNDAGVILNNTGAFPLAAAHFEQALSVMPASAEARKNLASALFNQGRIDEAIAEMSQCLQLNPGDKDAAARLEAMQSRKPLK